MQSLADEIRQSEATLFKKTAQVARERMAHYAYAADPGHLGMATTRTEEPGISDQVRKSTQNRNCNRTNLRKAQRAKHN